MSIDNNYNQRQQYNFSREVTKLISINFWGIDGVLTLTIRRNNHIITQWSVPVRFILPILIVILAKLFGAVFLYFFLKLDTLTTFWMNVLNATGSPTRWPFLFLGWDSVWYLSIPFFGYVGENWAFLPGYPTSIYLLDLIINNAFLSATLCSLVFGVAWIPFFQAVAERYMSHSAALKSALITAFFPYVFLFTTVAYSESLFLFACVASWYFYLNNKTLKANFLVAVATTTRMMGILMVLPIFLDALRRREYKTLLYTAVPLFALFAWFFYCYINAGDWLVSLTAQNTYWSMYSFRRWVTDCISNRTISNFDSFVVSPILWMPLMILTVIAIYYCRKVDWRLTIYSACYFFPILWFASLDSVVRYLSFIFPIWITFGTFALRSKWGKMLSVILCALFFPLSVLLWIDFLMGMWVA